MPSNTKPSSREGAIGYLREASATDPHLVDCVDHVCRIAARLHAEGASPSIGRLRDRQGDFHGPLTPLRFRSVTWTTHYVCCADGKVWDPLAGAPLPLGEYAMVVFGRPLAIAQFLSAEETADLLNRNALRDAFRHSAQVSS